MFPGSLALVIALAAPSSPPSGSVQAYRSPAAEKRASELRARLGKELRSLGGHDWAGDYYRGDGLGWNLSLSIAPATGFVFEEHGCLGLYGRNYGAVTSTDALISLKPELARSKGRSSELESDAWLPLTWGPRHYLIPSGAQLAFCNAVNAGREPRQDLGGSFYLRRGDEARPVTGQPRTSGGELSCLLARPISGQVASVGPTTYRGQAGIRSSSTPLTLDVGGADGVLIGMEFHVMAAHKYYAPLVVTRVLEHTSEASQRSLEGMDDVPRPGCRVSTRLFEP